MIYKVQSHDINCPMTLDMQSRSRPRTLPVAFHLQSSAWSPEHGPSGEKKIFLGTDTSEYLCVSRRTVTSMKTVVHSPSPFESSLVTSWWLVHQQKCPKMSVKYRHSSTSIMCDFLLSRITPILLYVIEFSNFLICLCKYDRTSSHFRSRRAAAAVSLQHHPWFLFS